MEQQRAMLKALKKIPAGTRQISEEERIKTLEDLIATKKELSSLMSQLPISMRSDAL